MGLDHVTLSITVCPSGLLNHPQVTLSFSPPFASSTACGHDVVAIGSPERLRANTLLTSFSRSMDPRHTRSSKILQLFDIRKSSVLSLKVPPSSPISVYHSTLEVNYERWSKGGNIAQSVGDQKHSLSYSNEKIPRYSNTDIVGSRELSSKAGITDGAVLQSAASNPPVDQSNLGQRRKTIFVSIAIAIVLVILCIIIGSVGINLAIRNRKETTTAPTDHPLPTTSTMADSDPTLLVRPTNTPV